MNNYNYRREKVFYVVMIIFYALFPFTLFFNVYEYRRTAKAIDGSVAKIVDKYNLINIKEVSNFAFSISILFIIISLALAIIMAFDLYEKKFYKTEVKVLSGLTCVVFSGLVFFFSVYLGSLFFMLVCCNLFMLSFDVKLNKNKKNNLIIYIPTYLLFIFMLFLALVFHPMS